MRALSPEEFLQTSVGANAQRELQLMVRSTSYHTNKSYNTQSGQGLVFVERHVNYLAKHPAVAPAVYLANLRVMTKLARS